MAIERTRVKISFLCYIRRIDNLIPLFFYTCVFMVEVAQAICVFTLTSKHPDKQVDHQDIRKYNRTRVYSLSCGSMRM